MFLRNYKLTKSMETTTNTRYEVSLSEDIFFNSIYYLDFEKRETV